MKIQDVVFDTFLEVPNNLDENRIFAQHAEAYWKANLPVFPLWPRKKEPIFSGWREYSVVMPSKDVQASWCKNYPNSNIGLPLGPCSEVSVIDIDTDDDKIIQAILSVLPKPIWVRKGAKGAVLGYKYNPSLKTFRIRTATNESIVEYLSEGTYVVLPPSIHPKTDKPYLENKPLHAVKTSMVSLTTDIELKLRGILKRIGVNVSDTSVNPAKVTEFVPSGSRDISLTRAAGLFAFAVLRGERTLLEAIEMLNVYAKQYVENVVGDAVDMNKHTANLILFLSRDIMQRHRILPEGWDSGMSHEQKNHYLKIFSEERVEKPATLILEELSNTLAQGEGIANDTVMNEIEKVLKLIAYSKNLNDIEVDRILHLIVRESGLGVRITSLHKQIKKYREAELFKGVNHTEIAQALIEELETINKIKCQNQVFYRWGGSHYEIYPDTELEREIHLRYGQCEANRKRSDTKGILQTVGSLTAAPLKDEDVEVNGVNFANGFLIRLPNGDFDLQPHEERWGCTYTLPFLTDLKALEKGEQDLRKLAPLFHQFLESCWGFDFDYKEKVAALQEALLCTLFGIATQYQRAFLLFGVAGSGKSQLLTIVSSLAPQEVKSSIPPEVWGDTFGPASMAGKLLNIAGELSESKPIKGQVFKEVVDGSEMMVQQKFKNPYTTKMIAAQWFAGNFLPKTKDTSEGFNRRWLIFSFTRVVSDKDKKINLGEEIVANERAGIIQWCLGASKRLVKQRGYTIPSSCRASVSEMGSLNNTVRAFLESKTSNIRIYQKDLGEGNIFHQGKPIGATEDPRILSCYQISESKLYEMYWAWTLTNTDKKPESLQSFKQTMKELSLAFNLNLKGVVGAEIYLGVGTQESTKHALGKLNLTIGV